MRDLCTVAEADGVSLIRNNRAETFGLCPQISCLSDWALSDKWENDLTISCRVRTDFPQLVQDWPEDIAGVLVFKLSGDGLLFVFDQEVFQLSHAGYVSTIRKT